MSTYKEEGATKAEKKKGFIEILALSTIKTNVFPLENYLEKNFPYFSQKAQLI